MSERRRAERRGVERRVAGPKLKPTRHDVVHAAKILHWKHATPNWTANVEGKRYPARALVLKATRASENHPVNGEQSAVILSNLGFEVSYKGKVIPSEDLPD